MTASRHSDASTPGPARRRLPGVVAILVRGLAVLAVWLAFPMVALATDPNETGTAQLYPLASVALVAGAAAAAANVARKAGKLTIKVETPTIRREPQVKVTVGEATEVPVPRIELEFGEATIQRVPEVTLTPGEATEVEQPSPTKLGDSEDR